ncbi:MAG: hypothetical protein U9Q21_00395 [Candidatus Auribacterota bacterium]|nr:hypothetical protein [Candidatus Auribacterota bacterium]
MINNEEKKRKLLDKVKDIDSQIDILRAQKEIVIFDLDNLDKSISAVTEVSSQNYRNSASTSEFSKSEKIDLFRRFFSKEN